MPARLKFQTEKWAEALPELLPLFDDLWADVAVDQDRFKAKCDEARYAACDAAGLIHLVTARSGTKELAGYYCSFVNTNPHYLGQGLMAFTDMYYLKPEFRRGTNGLKLFAFTEESLRERGVVKIYTSHKVHRDRRAMLEGLGFKPLDAVYSKVLL